LGRKNNKFQLWVGKILERGGRLLKQVDTIQKSRMLAPKKTHSGSKENNFEQFFGQKIK
jgi:hypothetical protein